MFYPSLFTSPISPSRLRVIFLRQEAAVRKTKRRSTRESACQTLTYRELRDHIAALSKASKSINPTSFAQEQSEDSHTRSSVSRWSVRANDPHFPASLVSDVFDVSDVTICRSTQDDDTEGDAATQDRGSVRTVDRWGTTRLIGGRTPNRGQMAESACIGGESGGGNGFETVQRNEGNGRGGHSQDEAIVAHTRTVVERLRQDYDVGKESAMCPLGATPHPGLSMRHSETTDSSGTSPPSNKAGRVCVSWEDRKSEEESAALLEAAMGFEGVIANEGTNEDKNQGAGEAHSKAGRLKKELEEDDSFCKCDHSRGDPDGNSSLLPKGLDYRKVKNLCDEN